MLHGNICKYNNNNSCEINTGILMSYTRKTS